MCMDEFASQVIFRMLSTNNERRCLPAPVQTDHLSMRSSGGSSRVGVNRIDSFGGPARVTSRKARRGALDDRFTGYPSR